MTDGPPGSWAVKVGPGGQGAFDAGRPMGSRCPVVGELLGTRLAVGVAE